MDASEFSSSPILHAPPASAPSGGARPGCQSPGDCGSRRFRRLPRFHITSDLLPDRFHTLGPESPCRFLPACDSAVCSCAVISASSYMLLTPYFLGPLVLFLRLPSFFLLCPAPLRLPAPAWPLPPRYELALTARPILFQFFSAWITAPFGIPFVGLGATSESLVAAWM